MHRTASASLHQTKQLYPAACTPTSSPLDMLKTPARVITQSTCPPAPKRQLPLTLYEISATDSQGQASSAESTDCTYLPAAPVDTADSLRRLMREARAVNSVQDMLCRLRPDAPGLAHSQDFDSAGCTPALATKVATPTPFNLEAGMHLPADQGAWQAKRMKLFGPVRSSTPTNHCVQPRCTEKLQLLQIQQCPPTAHSEPNTAQIDLITARTDSVRYAVDEITDVSLHTVALPLPGSSGFAYPHKVRRRHLLHDTPGRHVVSPPDSPLSPRDSSASELALSAAPDCSQAGREPPGSPALSEEGQSWREASFPEAEAFSTPVTAPPQSRYHRFPLSNGRQQLFISTFDLPQERPPPATLRPFYAPQQHWGQGLDPL